MQMVVRDRNRIAIQSDIFGATALGIKNMLCLSGDHQTFGNQPDAKNVFDIDSIQMISAVRRMRDEKKIFNSDEDIEGEVKLFIHIVHETIDIRAFHPLCGRLPQGFHCICVFLFHIFILYKIVFGIKPWFLIGNSWIGGVFLDNFP